MAGMRDMEWAKFYHQTQKGIDLQIDLHNTLSVEALKVI